MNIFSDLIHNYVLLTALSSWLIAQVIKIIINLNTQKKIVWERLFGDGGMPSGHSATVIALALMTGWCVGFNSPEFAIAGVLAVIVANDALGVRRETEKQAISINQLFTIINETLMEKDKVVQKEKLKLLVGHTPLQVFFGILLGAIVSVLSVLIFGIGYGVYRI